jgi:hypothetical protein
MIRAVTIWILRQVLLVIVGPEVFSCTEITEISGRDQSTGRLSVDIAADPPVDQAVRPITHELADSRINGIINIPLLYLILGDREDRREALVGDRHSARRQHPANFRQTISR